jgi:hypothetical protein
MQDKKADNVILFPGAAGWHLRNAEPDSEHIAKLYEMLEGGTFEEQVSALEQLKSIPSPETIAVFKEYLLLVYPPPILKTFVLQALKQMGETGKVRVYKFGQQFEAEIKEVPLSERELSEGARQVMQHIASAAYEGDASFLSFALQLWMEYLLAIYPLHPHIEQPSAWAGALHYSVSLLLGLEQSEEKVANLYNVPFSIIKRNYDSLAEVLHVGYQGLEREW